MGQLKRRLIYLEHTDLFSLFPILFLRKFLSFIIPGGRLNRTPTLHVLGSMDEDIVLNGKFKATKIQDIGQKK